MPWTISGNRFASNNSIIKWRVISMYIIFYPVVLRDNFLSVDLFQIIGCDKTHITDFIEIGFDI